MIKLLLKLLRFVIPRKKKASTDLPTSPSQEIKSSNSDSGVLKEPLPIHKEPQWFSRKNNLADEFAYEPIPVYSSNLSSDTIVGTLNAHGDIIGNDGRVVPQEEEELLEDDVEFLKLHPNYAKPNSNSKVAQYSIGLDQYKEGGDYNSEITIYKKYEDGEV